MTSHEGKVCKTRAGTQSEAKYSYLFLAAIYLVRISQGLFLSILSPTLLFLADNVDSEVASVSPMFTGKSLGFMFGSFAVGYSLRHHRPMLTLGIADFLCGAFMFFIPLVKSIWWLYALVTLCGLVYGYIDAAGQGLLLNIWGEERSRSLIQGYHFAFTIGAFIAPMIAKPFLEMASFIKDADAKCPKTVSFSSHLESTTSRSNTSTEEFQYNSTLTSVSIDTGLNPTVYVYFLFGTFAVIVSIFLFVLAALNATKKLKQLRRKETLTLTEERPEEPVRNIFGLLALITLFYFFLIGGEHPYIAHIFAISVCSKLHFSVSDASINNSVFWGGYGLGRLVAVPLANYVKPGKVIMMFLTGTVLTLAIMAIFGEWVPTIWWVTTFLYGFCSSPLYPAMVSWISQLANISGKYIFIVNLGNSIGSMSMVPVGAVIFQNKPFDLVYFSLGMAITMSIVFAVMIVYGKRYKKKIAYSKNEIELSQLNSE